MTTAPTSSTAGSTTSDATSTASTAAFAPLSPSSSGPAVVKASATTGCAPAAVSGLTATAGSNEASLSWTAAADNGSALTAYVVRVLSGPSAGESIANDGTATSITVTGLAGGAPASFSVVAVNACGQGPSASSGSVTPTGSASTFASQLISDAPSVYYRLNDPSGATMPDSSGHGLDGQYNGQVGLGGAPALLNDPGTSASDPSIWGGMASSPASLPQFNDPRTVSVWVNSRATNNPLLVGWGSSGTDQSFVVGFDRSGITVDGDNDYHTISTSHPVADGNWHLITVTFDGTIISAYLDGRLQGTSQFNGVLATFGSSLALGGSPLYYNPLSGSVQDLAVFPSALTASQISSLYQASGWAAPIAPPVAHAAADGQNAAQVTWGDASTADEPITGYVVTVATGPDAGMSAAYDGTTTGAVVQGLPAGSAAFTVTAINASGAGAPATTNAVTVAGAASTYASTILAAHPAAFLRLGDRWSSLLEDSSGHGGSGSYSSGAALDVGGPLVGDTTPAAAGDPSDGSVGTAAGSLPLYDTARTAEGWFKTSSTNPVWHYATVIGWGASGTDQAFSVGTTATSVWVDGSNDAHEFRAPYPLNDGIWHFVAVTYNGSSFTAYLDGRALGTGHFAGPLDTQPAALSGEGIPVGADIGQSVPGVGGSSFAQGALADIAVFPSALSSSQIAAEFAASGHSRPSAPGAPVAMAGANQATVSWSPASASGSTVSAYLVTAVANGVAGSSVAVPASATTAVVSGLSGGTAYAFNVSALDNYGWGSTAQAAAVTPTGPAQTYASTVASAGPSAYYRLGDATTAVLADSSGHGHLGSYVVNSGTLGAPGAIVGDGDSAARDGYGGLASAAVSGLPINNASRSVAAWIKGTSLPSDPGGPIVGWGTGGTDQVFRLLAAADSLTVDAGSDARSITTPYPLDDGSWHQVAASYNGSTVVVYLDGRQIGTASFAAGINTVAGVLEIGGDSSQYNTPAGLLIDDVAVYPRVLTVSQVSAQFAASGHGTPSAPAGVTALAGSNQVTVSWNAPPASADPVTHYVITALANGSSPQNEVSAAANQPSAAIGGLTGGTSYTFRVTPYNAYGPGTPTVSAAVSPTGATSTYSSAVLADHPAAYYRLSDGSPKALTDSSPAQATGQYNLGNATLRTPGPIAGDSATGVTLLTGGPAAVGRPALPGFATARTVEVWVKVPSGSPATGTLLGWGQAGGPDQWFNVGLSGGGAITVDAGSDAKSLPTPYAIDDGRWHEVDVTFDGTTLTAYLDGAAIGSAQFNGTLDTLASPLYIGSGPGQYDGPGSALVLAQAAVYPSALSAARVSAHFAAAGYGVPSAPSGVTAMAGSNQAVVSWNSAAAPGTSVTAYEVSAFTGGVREMTTAVSANAGSAVISGLPAGVAYQFEVRALDAYGWGPFSALSSAVTPSGAATTYSSSVLADTPVAYYRLGDGTPAVLSDSSTSGRDGAYSASDTTLNQAGALPGDSNGAALDADGNAIGSVLAPVPSHNDARTVQAWVEDSSLSDSPQTVVAWGGEATDRAFRLQVSNHAVTVDAWSDARSAATPYPIGDGTWHAIGVTYTGSTYALYLDGRQIGTGTFSVPLDTDRTAVHIGGDVNGSWGPQGAVLDQVSIYGAALSASQIAAQIAAAGVGVPAAPTSVAALAGTNQASVTWNAPASSPSTDGYRVTALANGTVPVNAKTVSASATSAVITGLAAGTPYTFEVVARNGFGYGAAGTSGSVTPSGSASTYATSILAGHPSVYYRLGDSTFAAMADSSGHRADGTYLPSGVTQGSSGAISSDAADTAVSSSGSPIGTAAATLPYESQPRSVLAWVQTTAGGYQGIAGWGNTSNTEGFSVGFDGSDVYADEYGASLTFASPKTLDDGAWHLVAVTYDGTNVTAYVDGTSLGAQTFASPVDTAPGTQLVIGAPVWRSQAIDGSLDELAVFPSALSATQISALATAGGLAPAVVPAHTAAALNGAATGSGTATATTSPLTSPVTTVSGTAPAAVAPAAAPRAPSIGSRVAVRTTARHRGRHARHRKRRRGARTSKARPARGRNARNRRTGA